MRELFLLDPDLVFLNHGSYGACPTPVFEVLQHWQREMERNPVAFLGRRSAALLAEARAALAGFVGARADDLVFVPNATTAVNTVARSFHLEPGDEVLGTDHEYGACEAAWQKACAARGAVYRRVAVGLPFEAGRFVETVMRAVTPRTRLIFASHLASTTALVFPVAELCAAARARGIATLIDGAHAPGQIDLDLEAIGADFYTGNAHKWLCAPKGAGFLHVRAEHHAVVQAPVVSWGYVAEAAQAAQAAPHAGASAGTLGGHTGFDAYTGRTVLERRLQWQGTRDIAAFLAVPAAIDFVRTHAGPETRRRCHALAIEAQQAVTARNGLAPIGRDEDFALMVPIPVRAADPEALRVRLFEHHGIEVPVTVHDAGDAAGPRVFVRISVAPYTTREEVGRLVAALAAEGV